MNNDLREWMGVAPADFPVYFAVICVVLAYSISDFALDAILISLAIIACVVSCFIGMKRDEKVSGFTNAMKLASYPICLFACVILGVVNFVFWN